MGDRAEVREGVPERDVRCPLLLDLEDQAARDDLIINEDLDAVEAQLERTRRIAELPRQPVLAQDEDFNRWLAVKKVHEALPRSRHGPIVGDRARLGRTFMFLSSCDTGGVGRAELLELDPGR